MEQLSVSVASNLELFRVSKNFTTSVKILALVGADLGWELALHAIDERPSRLASQLEVQETTTIYST